MEYPEGSNLLNKINENKKRFEEKQIIKGWLQYVKKLNIFI